MKTEIIPVIHMINRNQVLTNVKACVDCGIKKVFLINHQTPWESLVILANDVRELYPEIWIGLNMLDISTKDSLNMGLKFDGLWCDATISSEDAKQFRNFDGMFFGGLAFKYQPQPDDLKAACDDAILSTDVATTSGLGTGKAADLEKIKTIRTLLGKHPMAIASGVSIDNIDDYSGVVDYLLVASSITSFGEIIIKEKLIDLIDKLKN